MTKPININKNHSKEFMEEAATSTSETIQETFKINVKNGKGYYETEVNNTFWSRLIITARILNPENGIWTIVIRDKTNRNLIVYEDHQVVHDKEVFFNYKTGLKVNFLIEATWSENKNTTLMGELSIKY
jgi:hypothetical protein